MGAFVSKKTFRVELSAEQFDCLDADAWVELREGVSAQMYQRMLQAGTDEIAQAVAYLSDAITAWSWEEPITPEAVADLNLELLIHLGKEGQQRFPLALRNPSAPGTAPG